MPTKILIVDDDHAVCASLQLVLKKKDYETFAVNHPTAVISMIDDFKPDLILLDMNFTIATSGRQGLRLLEMIMEKNADLPVILMTGWATVQLAVQGMKLGARDFIAKPWDNVQLLNSIAAILYLRKESSKEVEKINDTEENIIIGDSEVFLEVKNIAFRVAQTNASVLITGESGTGKEVISEYIHQSSKRRDKPFVKVNLGGIPESLFESEMFGHKKGAFTDAHNDRIGRFEKADTGTIFLDEIGELPMANQVKLLRVLQEKTYEVLGSSVTKKSDVRVISATNKNLETQVYNNDFREDLYYRINLIHIHIPALRERKSDIPLLVKYFAENICRLHEIYVPKIDKDALHWLQEQVWPGNIRQLKNIIESTILLNSNKKSLSWKDFQNQSPTTVATKINLPKVGTMSLEDMEIKMIRKTLAHHNNVIAAAARDLGITRSALYRRLEKYNIPYES